MNLSKEVIQQDVVVLRLEGVMRMGADCQRLTREAEQLIQDNERRIILDLSPLKLVDSAGVGAIVACFSLAKKAGGTLRLAGATGMVETVLKVAQIDRAIGLFPTVAQAASYLPPTDQPPTSNS